VLVAGRFEPEIAHSREDLSHEVALNGSTTTLTNPNVPRSPEQITAEAIACIDRGATIVHNHNDEGLITPDGVHSAEPYLEAWQAILSERPETLLYPTMASGGPGISREVRWAHHLPLVKPVCAGWAWSIRARSVSGCSIPAACRWHST
jgi:uncharacterized protein (DUF849 family)